MQSSAPKGNQRLAPRRGCRRRRGVGIALCAALVALAAGGAETFLEGRVVAVFDGDTLEMLVDGAPRRIRIAGVDTPERGQPWAAQARRALSERVFDKRVKVNEIAVDRYGRSVGEVYADDVCVGCELVRAGHAWVYRDFTDDPVLFELEAEARAARRGLWSLPEAQRKPPWEWRRARRRAAEAERRRSATPGAQVGPTPLACVEQRTCGQLLDCEEARFLLTVCGFASLDGDGDGIPCEALCAAD